MRGNKELWLIALITRSLERDRVDQFSVGCLKTQLIWVSGTLMMSHTGLKVAECMNKQ